MFNFNKLKAYLETNGYKQKFIAQKAGLNEATMSGIITGRVKCSVDTYVNICRVLSVPFNKFIDDLNQPQTE